MGLRFDDRQAIRCMLDRTVCVEWSNISGFWLEIRVGRYKLPVAPRLDGT